MAMLLTLENHHATLPPLLPPGGYIGYFANEHGEQSIYTYDPATGEALVLVGDADWKAHPVTAKGTAAGLLLTPSERLWLCACWDATVGARP
jgi:hypothetical protein